MFMGCERDEVRRIRCGRKGEKEGGRCCTGDIYIAFSDMVGWTGCKADVRCQEAVHLGTEGGAAIG
jgi:hypothetical protein